MAFQVITCVALPAITKYLSSSTPNRLRKSWKVESLGSFPSTSAAKHLLPSRSPISSSKTTPSPRVAGFLASPPGPSPSCTSILSPLKANHSWPANSFSPVEEWGQILGRVQGQPSCSVQDLLAATGPWRDDDTLPRAAHRREESSLSHLHGDLVVSLLVAEEPGHPAAARVDHLDVGGEPEQPLRRARPYERLLMAVSVQEDRGAFSQRKLRVEIQNRLLEEAGGLCQSFDALVIGDELPVVVAHGKDAARLEADERDSTLHERHKQVEVAPRVLPCLVHEPLGEHGPSATDDLGQMYSRPRGREEPHGPLPYLGPLVLVLVFYEEGDL